MDVFVNKTNPLGSDFCDFFNDLSELWQSDLDLKLASNEGEEPWKEAGKGGRPRKGQETPKTWSKSALRSWIFPPSGETPEDKHDHKGGKNPPRVNPGASSSHRGGWGGQGGRGGCGGGRGSEDPQVLPGQGDAPGLPGLKNWGGQDGGRSGGGGHSSEKALPEDGRPMATAAQRGAGGAGSLSGRGGLGQIGRAHV